MAKFINPFTDVGFKRIFGQEFSKPLLLDFLNNLLVGERHITSVQIVNSLPSTTATVLPSSTYSARPTAARK